jgi:hypothetical protein
MAATCIRFKDKKKIVAFVTSKAVGRPRSALRPEQL